MTRLSIQEMCRGDGKGYIRFLCDIESDFRDWHACLSAGVSKKIACPVIPEDKLHAVITFPLLDAPVYSIVLNSDYGEESHFTVDARQLKWQSRFNYRFRRQAAYEIRDIDDGDHCPNQLVPKMTFCVKTAGRIAVACDVAAPNGGVSLRAHLYDEMGTELVSHFADYGPTRSSLSVSAYDPIEIRRCAFILPDLDRTYFLFLEDVSGKNLMSFIASDPRTRFLARQTLNFNAEDPASNDRYDTFLQHAMGDKARHEAQRATQFTCKPVFSIIVPLFKTPLPFLHDMADSVLKQTYPFWELVLVNASPEDVTLYDALERLKASEPRISVVTLDGNLGIATNTARGIEHATGDYLCFLDHDDCIEPDTLFYYQQAISADPSCDLLFCDEDHFKEVGEYFNPHFKPGFNLELLRSHNYVTHFLTVSHELLDAIGPSTAAFDGAQDYDLTLRACEKAKGIAHVPHVLYHWRMHAESSNTNPEGKAYAHEAGRRALQGHFQRCGIDAEVQDGPLMFTYLPLYRAKPDSLVVVLTSKTRPSSVNARLYDALAEATAVEEFSVVPCEDTPSAKNEAVRGAEGNMILFLDESIYDIRAGDIDRMIGAAQRTDTGPVGGRLLYENDLVEKAGVAIGGLDRPLLPLHRFLQSEDYGYYMQARLSQNVSGITSEFMLIGRSVFLGQGGFDESFCTPRIADMDLCSTLRQKTRRGAVLLPTVSVHRKPYEESNLDGLEFHKDLYRFYNHWPEYYISNDPFINPNLDQNSPWYSMG